MLTLFSLRVITLINRSKMNKLDLLFFSSFWYYWQRSVRNCDDAEIDEIEHNGVDADRARCARYTRSMGGYVVTISEKNTSHRFEVIFQH